MSETRIAATGEGFHTIANKQIRILSEEETNSLISDCGLSLDPEFNTNEVEEYEDSCILFDDGSCGYSWVRAIEVVPGHLYIVAGNKITAWSNLQTIKHKK